MVSQSADLGKNFKIIEKRWLGDRIFSMWIDAPDIARAFRPGNFVVVRLDEAGERIPLTIVAVNEQRTQIRLVVEVVGYTTGTMSQAKESELLLDVVGPLGKPIEPVKYPDPVVGIADGIGTATLLPQLAGYREAGNKIVALLGARSVQELLLVEEIQKITRDLHLMTEEGGLVRKGLVTDALIELFGRGLKPSLILVAGPTLVMKSTCEVAAHREIPVLANLHPLMVDGMGMCGGCRVTVGDEALFACVDGPLFDGSKVNWDELVLRLETYKRQERYVFEHVCKIGFGRTVL